MIVTRLAVFTRPPWDFSYLTMAHGVTMRQTIVYVKVGDQIDVLPIFADEYERVRAAHPQP